MTSDEIINSLQNSIQFVHLKKEIVELPGRDEPFVPSRKILVIEQCGLTEARSGRFDSDIKTNPIHNEFIDVLDEFGAARLYIDLASVSFGDVPSLLEFIAMLPSDTSTWLEKAVKVNPQMFMWITEMQKVIESVDKAYFDSLSKNNELKKADEETLKKKRTRRK